MSKYDDRVGEKKIAYNGLEMEIVAYRSSDDIDVRFSDGTIVEHRAYSAFRKGLIGLPGSNRKIRKSHLGEKRIANNGIEMEIVGYRSLNDIDVQFSNGFLVEHRRYSNFANGNIGFKLERASRKNRIGEKSIATCGLEMEIIEYRNSMDIDVQFSDGRIKHHVTYWCFTHGSVSPNEFTDKIGEKRIAHNGMEMEIVGYRGVTDIDVRFADGTIVKHKRYCNFKAGNIKYPSVSRIGEAKTATNGMTMTIIKYRNARDIDVQFEDGSISRHKTYLAFCDGYIKPNQEDVEYQKKLSFAKGKIGILTELQKEISSECFAGTFEDVKQHILKKYAEAKIELDKLTDQEQERE